MAGKRFDPTLKRLVEAFPRDWVDYFAPLMGLPTARQVDVIESEVSTITAASDKVIRVGGPHPWIFHLELLASHNARLAQQLLLYNVLLGERHDLPIHSAVLLLRREANRSSVTGQYVRRGVAGVPYLEFHYSVIRLWELSPESLLQGGLGLLPLAPVTEPDEAKLPRLVRQMESRLNKEGGHLVNDLWAATFVLLGLQHDEAVVESILRGVRAMKESVTYQAILREGKAEGKAEGALSEARKLLIRLGGRTLGEPDGSIRQTIEELSSLENLENLIEDIQEVETWEELLKRNKPRRAKRRKPNA